MAPSSPPPSFPSSDLSDREAVLRRRRGPQFKFLVPLIYAPILPLIRIGLRRNPVVRDRLFYGVLAGAFAHGAYLVFHYYHYHMVLQVVAVETKGFFATLCRGLKSRSSSSGSRKS